MKVNVIMEVKAEDYQAVSGSHEKSEAVTTQVIVCLSTNVPSLICG